MLFVCCFIYPSIGTCKGSINILYGKQFYTFLYMWRHILAAVWPCSVAPKTTRNVAELPVRLHMIEPLVGSRLVERAEMSQIWPKFDIVERANIHISRQENAPAVPADTKLWIMLPNPSGEPFYLFRVAIASHETHACYFKMLRFY